MASRVSKSKDVARNCFDWLTADPVDFGLSSKKNANIDTRAFQFITTTTRLKICVDIHLNAIYQPYMYIHVSCIFRSRLRISSIEPFKIGVIEKPIVRTPGIVRSSFPCFAFMFLIKTATTILRFKDVHTVAKVLKLDQLLHNNPHDYMTKGSSQSVAQNPISHSAKPATSDV